jgi:hypothetical protein
MLLIPSPQSQAKKLSEKQQIDALLLPGGINFKGWAYIKDTEFGWD